jgi:type II secretory pathway pseudopilin PulG
MTYKKGAMFGLDARIALAIFGALSVISGAALYSAIQSAKAEQYRQYFVELVKASEAYYLDTGSQIPFGTAIHILDSSNLIDNRKGLANWNGPYIDATPINDFIFTTSVTENINSTLYSGIILQKNSEWANNTSVKDCDVKNIDCSEYVLISNGGDSAYTPTLLDIFNLLDNLSDNGDGPLKGTIRFIEQSSGLAWVMYRGISHQRPS